MDRSSLHPVNTNTVEVRVDLEMATFDDIRILVANCSNEQEAIDRVWLFLRAVAAERRADIGRQE